MRELKDYAAWEINRSQRTDTLVQAPKRHECIGFLFMMKNIDKANLLEKRHIKVLIEWGGTDLFINCSDMTTDGVTELLDILQLNKRDEINQKITDLVQKEHERQED